MKGSYTIKPGNIAAVCYVIAPDGTQFDCIYISHGRIEVGVRDTPKFSTFPAPVQEAVIRHFNNMFSIPVSYRGAALKATKMFDVEVES